MNITDALKGVKHAQALPDEFVVPFDFEHAPVLLEVDGCLMLLFSILLSFTMKKVSI
jgi:hypothetical protein